MFNTALRLTGNRPDAEDVLQESFADAFHQLRSFEHKASFGAWLKQIVIYKCIGMLKKRKASFVELEEHIEQIPQESERDEQETELTVAAVKDAMKELPDGYRTVVTLYLLEGYDHEEIADIMQVAQSTVRTQYIRGKQKLLKLLKKEDVHE